MLIARNVGSGNALSVSLPLRFSLDSFLHLRVRNRKNFF